MCQTEPSPVCLLVCTANLATWSGCCLLVLQLPHSQHKPGWQEPFCQSLTGRLLFIPQSPPLAAPEQLLHPTTVPAQAITIRDPSSKEESVPFTGLSLVSSPPQYSGDKLAVVNKWSAKQRGAPYLQSRVGARGADVEVSCTTPGSLPHLQTPWPERASLMDQSENLVGRWFPQCRAHRKPYEWRLPWGLVQGNNLQGGSSHLPS